MEPDQFGDSLNAGVGDRRVCQSYSDRLYRSHVSKSMGVEIGKRRGTSQESVPVLACTENPVFRTENDNRSGMILVKIECSPDSNF